jgi:hypothetical protein
VEETNISEGNTTNNNTKVYECNKIDEVNSV